jgi:hypothetical protein
MNLQLNFLFDIEWLVLDVVDLIEEILVFN